MSRIALTTDQVDRLIMARVKQMARSDDGFLVIDGRHVYYRVLLEALGIAVPLGRIEGPKAGETTVSIEAFA